jgi:DNA-binding MarR family transcriptional regulator
MLQREDMLCFSLGVAMRRISRIYAEALHPFEITPPQLFLLTCLQNDDGRKPCDLADQVCLDASSLTGLIDRTERLGLVVRRPDPTDRRAQRIFLTEQGKSRLRELEPVIAQVQERVEAEFFAGYTRPQIETFLKILRQVQEVVT